MRWMETQIDVRLRSPAAPEGSANFLPNHHADLAGHPGRIYRFELHRRGRGVMSLEAVDHGAAV